MLAVMSSITTSNSLHQVEEETAGSVDPGAAGDDLAELLDDHTRQLLQRPRTSRRSRLVPRALIFADVLGLTLAYLVATIRWGGHGTIGSTQELILFALSLPCW